MIVCQLGFLLTQGQASTNITSSKKPSRPAQAHCRIHWTLPRPVVSFQSIFPCVV